MSPSNPTLLQDRADETRAELAVGTELCVVVPTYNERDNVAILVERLHQVLSGVSWEVVFVDDDSPDGTSARLRELAQRDPRVRCIRRIRRRGLSSACIEGMLSTSAAIIAVIDGDLQHDEALLMRMLDRLRRGDTDLVIASRYIEDGSSEGLANSRRKRLSQYGARLARLLVNAEVSDPVSGFFMLRRDILDEVAPRLSGIGTKILIDILASVSRPLAIAELPYRFRARHAGESKLDTFTGFEYVLLLAEKAGGRLLSYRLLLFGFVGATGVAVNLLAWLLLAKVVSIDPSYAEVAAIGTAMVWNFWLNNVLTYRDCRLVGWRAVRGLFSFIAVCALGALVNFAVWSDIYAATGWWLLAGISGAAVGALLNYALTSVLTWGRRG
jgi:dolichol-phosphate mannosyltransferase